MKKLIALLALAVLVTGCSTAQERREAAADSNKEQAAHNEREDKAQQPLLKITGIKGQALKIENLESLEVWMPQQRRAWVPAQVQRSDFVEALSIGKDLALGLAPLGMTRSVVGGVVKMGESIERAGTKGYEFVQAPPVSGAVDNSVHTVGDNSGANSGNSGKISGANLNDTNSGANSGNTDNTDSSNHDNPVTYPISATVAP